MHHTMIHTDGHATCVICAARGRYISHPTPKSRLLGVKKKTVLSCEDDVHCAGNRSSALMWLFTFRPRVKSHVVEKLQIGMWSILPRLYIFISIVDIKRWKQWAGNRSSWTLNPLLRNVLFLLKCSNYIQTSITKYLVFLLNFRRFVISLNAVSRMVITIISLSQSQ